MSRRAMIWVVLLMLAAAMLYSACRGGDDDDDDAATTPTPPPDACEDNEAPVLGEIQLSPLGSTTAATEFMEGDPIQVYVGYRDADCNVSGGDVFYALDGSALQQIEAIHDAPCEAAPSDQAAGFAFLTVGVGEHELAVVITDQCAAESNQSTVSFTLTPFESDDDTADDDTVEPTLLTGEIRYSGTEDYADRPVKLMLFTEWLPESLPVGLLEVTVPEAGFPFAYEWNFDDDAIAAGTYYLTAYLDAVDGDGAFNPAADPVYSPYLPVEVVAAQTTTQNVTLVAPAR